MWREKKCSFTYGGIIVGYLAIDTLVKGVYALNYRFE